MKKHIPNTITCINVLGGCCAIIFAFHPYEQFAGIDGWRWSAIAIAVAALADFLDGFAARLLHAYSDMGKELDSLCDLVSFGVAPAMLMLNIIGIDKWWAWASLIIPVCGALRLARFNIDTRQTTSFIGLPIPANAIFWIGYAATLASGWHWMGAVWAWLPAAIIVSLLMVSPMPLFSLKFKNYAWQGNARRWILLFASFGLICWLGLPSLTLIIILYFLLSIKA